MTDPSTYVSVVLQASGDHGHLVNGTDDRELLQIRSELEGRSVEVDWPVGRWGGRLACRLVGR